ncbi:hypothetical protein GE09DRAFT_1219704 [Coniochaeta sp. 2T2.1]|nr:hypothetical protein GE09DRAFT_1219704 [Coniochaeta sp. 2T2.1]
METPSSLFADYIGIDGTSAFEDGRRTATLDLSYPMFADRVVKREGSFPSTTRLNMSPRRGDIMWDGAEATTETSDPDLSLSQQPMFVRPSGLYTEAGDDGDNDTIMALRDRASNTPSQTPELVRATRPTSSRKTTLSMRSEASRSSNSSTSLSTATAITPPDPQPPRKRTRSTKKIKKEDAQPAPPPEEDKRNKFLERNRIAASKCREKKKQFVSELEETKNALEQQHLNLQVEYNSLVTEVGTLKHELMTHAKCNDGNIDKWIANEARKFVHTSDLFGYQRAAAAATAEGQQPDGDNPYATHRRQSSAASSVQQHGLGSFSSTDGARRDSLAFSQGTSFDYGPEDSVDAAWAASSVQASPTDMVFPTLPSPKYGREPAINFDHMPDELFDTEQ